VYFPSGWTKSHHVYHSLTSSDEYSRTNEKRDTSLYRSSSFVAWHPINIPEFTGNLIFTIKSSAMLKFLIILRFFDDWKLWVKSPYGMSPPQRLAPESGSITDAYPFELDVETPISSWARWTLKTSHQIQSYTSALSFCGIGGWAWKRQILQSPHKSPRR